MSFWTSKFLHSIKVARCRPASQGSGAQPVEHPDTTSQNQYNPNKYPKPLQKSRVKAYLIFPAHTRELVPLRSNYEFLDGMPTVLVNAESLDEIMADKVLAFPCSLLDNQGQPVGPDSAKIRHRDIWDLAWMATRGAKLVPELVLSKIEDYGVEDYPALLAAAIKQIPQIVKSPQFQAQMTRFIDSSTVARTLATDGYADYLVTSVGGLFIQMQAALFKKG